MHTVVIFQAATTASARRDLKEMEYSAMVNSSYITERMLTGETSPLFHVVAIGSEDTSNANCITSVEDGYTCQCCYSPGFTGNG